MAVALLEVLAAACGGTQDVPPTAGTGGGPAPVPIPGSYTDHRQRFLDLYLRKDYAAAMKEALAALEAAPGEREPYMLVSKTFIDAGQDAQGAEFFGLVAGKLPDQPEPWFFKGFHEARLGRWEEARASLEKAVSLAPADGEAHYRLGLVLEKRGEAERAIEELRKAYEMSGRTAGKASSLMTALSAKGRDAEAEAIAQEILSRAPDSAETQYAVARLRLAQKRWPEAEAALERALALSPGFAPARADLDRLLAARR